MTRPTEKCRLLKNPFCGHCVFDLEIIKEKIFYRYTYTKLALHIVWSVNRYGYMIYCFL